MNEMRKLMETVNQLTEGEKKGNVERLVDRMRKKYEAAVAWKLTGMFGGKTVILNELVKGDRGYGWKDVEITVDHVEYDEVDSNGPVFVDTKGKRHQSHPEHNVKIVG